MYVQSTSKSVFMPDESRVLVLVLSYSGRPAGQQHTVEDGEGGLYASMSIPNLSIGTVGGGTMLPTQKECLSMIGCSGSVRI